MRDSASLEIKKRAVVVQCSRCTQTYSRWPKTEEKRELIKWIHARRIFFDRHEFGSGLALARECRHPDARLLVSLFPDGAPATGEQAARVFLVKEDDARFVLGGAVREPAECVFA